MRSRSRLFRGAALGTVALVAAGLGGCSLGASASQHALIGVTSSDATAAEDDFVTLDWVIDGDTIETSAGKVRLIGIDTPERGQCGYEEASEGISELLAEGDPLVLVLPPGQNDEDSYGRLLRYVYTADGTDVGLAQIDAGHAVARYDSRDGYPEHPYEGIFRDHQVATRDADGDVVTTSCGGGSTSSGSGAGFTEVVPSGDEWWTKYGSCSKLKKNTVGDPTGPFDVNDPAETEIYNWFQYGTGYSGDGDGDGLACE